MLFLTEVPAVGDIVTEPWGEINVFTIWLDVISSLDTLNLHVIKYSEFALSF